MALALVSGSAVVPGAQVFVWKYPEGTVAILYPTDTLDLMTPVLANPYTTDPITGAYSFYTDGQVQIVELL